MKIYELSFNNNYYESEYKKVIGYFTSKVQIKKALANIKKPNKLKFPTESVLAYLELKGQHKIIDDICLMLTVINTGEIINNNY